LRIALITREFPPDTAWGGISSFYEHFAHGLCARGHDVEVFTQGLFREHSEKVGGLLVHRVLARRGIVGEPVPGDRGGNADLGDFAFSLAQELLRAFLTRQQEAPFDLVEGHEHLGVNALINQYAPDSVVTVTRYHTAYHSLVKRGLVDWPVSPRIASLERLSLTAADHRIATSGFIDLITREDFDLAAPAPVLANFTTPPPPAPAAAPARENLIVFAGRLVLAHKRPDLAAQAFARLAGEFPDWRIEFAGPDMDLPDGRTTWQVCAGHLAACPPDRFHYHGVLAGPAMDLLYRRARLLIVPSRFESFGMVAIEAMHRGCVPVVADQTALIDVVDDAALIFHNGAVDDLVGHLRPLMADAVRWQEKSAACQLRAARDFDPDYLFKQNLYHFESLRQARRDRIQPPPAASSAPGRPLISVVTPSFNQGRYIEETIVSILDQDYPRFEHLVMDGGSTDETLRILQKYPHLRWVSERDLGQTHAINKGLLQARGEIVAYLNSDDVYRAGTFHAVADFFRDHPETQIVVGNCDIIGVDSRVTGHWKARAGGVAELVQYWRWGSLHCTPQQSVFFRRSLLAEIGLFDPRFHMVMDYNFWLRTARRHRFEAIDRTLAAFRVVPTTKTGGRADEMYLEEYAASREFWPDLPLGRRLGVAAGARRQVARKMLDLAEHFLLRTTQGRRPLRFLRTAWTYWPPVMFDPRFVLTFCGAVAKGSDPVFGRLSKVHLWYLQKRWQRMQKA